MTGPEAASLGMAPGDLAVSSAVLCPVCFGDWCAVCDWSGLSRPVEPVATVHTLPVTRPVASGVAA